MKVTVIRDNSDGIEVELDGEDHTICSVLRDILNRDKKVENAAYRMEHRLYDVPRIYVKTKGNGKSKGEHKIIQLKDIKGIGPRRIEQLKLAGIKNAEDLLRVDINDISENSGIPLKMLEKYVKEAKKVVPKDPYGNRAILKRACDDLAKHFSTIKAKFEEAL